MQRRNLEFKFQKSERAQNFMRSMLFGNAYSSGSYKQDDSEVFVPFLSLSDVCLSDREPKFCSYPMQQAIEQGKGNFVLKINEQPPNQILEVKGFDSKEANFSRVTYELGKGTKVFEATKGEIRVLTQYILKHLVLQKRAALAAIESMPILFKPLRNIVSQYYQVDFSPELNATINKMDANNQLIVTVDELKVFDARDLYYIARDLPDEGQLILSTPCLYNKIINYVCGDSDLRILVDSHPKYALLILSTPELRENIFSRINSFTKYKIEIIEKIKTIHSQVIEVQQICDKLLSDFQAKNPVNDFKP